MLPEDVWLVVAVGLVLGIVGWPIYRFAHSRRRSGGEGDALAEAQERLRVAKLEAEAARVNREAERIYEAMYQEALDDHRDPASRVASGEEAPDDPAAPAEIRKRGGDGNH